VPRPHEDVRGAKGFDIVNDCDCVNHLVAPNGNNAENGALPLGSAPAFPKFSDLDGFFIIQFEFSACNFLSLVQSSSRIQTLFEREIFLSRRVRKTTFDF
jgi:hypothetical protein